ncbi:MAG: hypothetical protein ACMXX7_01280 [Candidatus Woesearchaeota archaeon]
MNNLETIKQKIVEEANITAEELTKKIKSKLEELSGLISEEGAAHIVANDLGVDLLKTDGVVKIKDLMPGMKDVSMNAKVIRKYDLRTFNRQSGEQGKVAKALVGDETGITMLVFWDDKTKYFESINDNDIINAKNLNVRDNNSRTEVHLGTGSEVKVNPEGVEIKTQTSSNAPPSQIPRKKISDITKEDSYAEVLATIVQVFDIKFFEKNGETGSVLNIFIDDGTDNMRTVLWKEQIPKITGLSQEEIMKFKDKPEEFEKIKTELLGKIQLFQGRVNFNEMFSRIELVINDVKNPDPKKEIETQKQQEKQTEKEEPIKSKTQESDDDLDEELLSLEDLEDI